MKASDPARGIAKRLVLVSNRLPITFSRGGDGWQAVSSSGGLVTAMGPVLRNRGGLWVGWSGVEAEEIENILHREQQKFGFSLAPVSLSADEKQKFYFGFSNEIIWPLFHSLHSLCNYDPEYWSSYKTVNAKFAAKVLEHTTSNDYIWVHDYHLISLGKNLRQMGANHPLGFFLHIPFPPPDIFEKMPWSIDLLMALLEYELIGFQTQRYKRNFLQAMRAMVKNAKISNNGGMQTLQVGERKVLVGSFPIGIDAKAFSNNASVSEVEHQVLALHQTFPGCRKILGVDRLDYTKGIPHKLDGFRQALLRYPELHRQITLIQVLVPSREDIPDYHELRGRIEQQVGEINGLFSTPDWTPIHYMFRSLKRDELLAYYRACEIALVTPLDDGMNLVAKEYCACSNAADSVLVLSEFAGSAAQLRVGALTVNPYDQVGIAKALHRAFTMPLDERRFRMRRLQKVVREQDIFGWVDRFLQAGSATELRDYPTLVRDQHEQVDDSWWWGSL